MRGRSRRVDRHAEALLDHRHRLGVDRPAVNPCLDLVRRPRTGRPCRSRPRELVAVEPAQAPALRLGRERPRARGVGEVLDRDDGRRHARWQLLVRDAVRAVGLGAEQLAAVLLVGLEVALEPRDLRVALEREDVRRDAVQEPAIVGDDHRAAREASSASSSARSVSTSRSLVGSSSSRTLPPVRSSLARCRRLRSPPESLPTSFCWSEPLKLNADVYWRASSSSGRRPGSGPAAGDLLPDASCRRRARRGSGRRRRARRSRRSAACPRRAAPGR